VWRGVKLYNNIYIIYNNKRKKEESYIKEAKTWIKVAVGRREGEACSRVTDLYSASLKYRNTPSIFSQQINFSKAIP